MKARTNDGASCASRIARILDTIRERDGVVGAYCEVLADQPRADAAKMDVMPLDQRGPLCGVGVGIKEVFDVAGGLCGWGSDIHAGRRPKHDAVIVRALRDAAASSSGRPRRPNTPWREWLRRPILSILPERRWHHRAVRQPPSRPEWLMSRSARRPSVRVSGRPPIAGCLDTSPPKVRFPFQAPCHWPTSSIIP